MELMKYPEISTVVWALVGFVVGMIGLFIFDFTVPAFAIKRELNEKNPAIGIVMAGWLFSIGIIIYNSMLHSELLMTAVKYSAIGIILNIILYHLVNLLLPGWQLSKAIDDHNQGAAWFVFGMFLLIGQCIGGALS